MTEINNRAWVRSMFIQFMGRQGATRAAALLQKYSAKTFSALADDKLRAFLADVSAGMHAPPAGADLTVKQIDAAKKLKAQRPVCVPGTNAIISAAEARVWHDEVAQVAVTHGITGVQEKAFFDLAGVAE